MNLDADLRLRQSSPVWFDGQTTDVSGLPVRMYSVVTPIDTVTQFYAADEEPVVVEPGSLLVVVGRADDDSMQLWLEVDDTGPFSGAHVCLPVNRIRYVCEVGEGPHMRNAH